MSDELKPRNRKEQYYEYMATGNNTDNLKPRSREEQWFEKIAEGGGGTDIAAIAVTESENQLVIALQDSEGQTIVESTPVGVQGAITDGSATIVSIDSSDIITIKAGVVQTNGAIANSNDSDITLAKVAKTGDYDDLDNKPVIPDVSDKMDKNNPTGTGSLFMNAKTGTSAGYAATLGKNCTVKADNSVAEGYKTIAGGNQAHAEGNQTFAHYNSHSEGYGTVASNGHAEGSGSIASGSYSHAEGEGDCYQFRVANVNQLYYDYFTVDPTTIYHQNDAIRIIGGDGYWALTNNYISSISSGSMGSGRWYCYLNLSYNISNIDINDYVIVTKGHEAKGKGSHIEGYDNIAQGNYSHVEGQGNESRSRSQHIFGEYNTIDTYGSSDTRGTYVEIVGKGTASNSRSNARTLDWSGNEVLAGTVQATGFKTASGSSSEFLKADGSVDNSTYITSLPSGSAVIASESSSIITLKAGLIETDGVITNSSDSDITLAKVAKTGAYSDLSGTPTIPTIANYSEYCTTGNFIDDADNYGSSDCILRFDRYGDMVHLTGRFSSTGMTTGTTYQLVYYYSGWTADFPKHDSSNAVNLLAYWDGQPISDTDYKGEIFNFTSNVPTGHIFNDHGNFYVQPLTNITSGSLVYFSLTYKCRGNN